MFYTNEEKECIRECIEYIKGNKDPNKREKTIFNNKVLDEMEITLSKDVIPNKAMSINIKLLIDDILVNSLNSYKVDIPYRCKDALKSAYNKSLDRFRKLNEEIQQTTYT